MGYTHIEFLPIMEHPVLRLLGLSGRRLLRADIRFGTPDDFMYFVDRCHQAGIGVIVDWVPAHFPKRRAWPGFLRWHRLYEHADPRKGEHRDWGTLIFNLRPQRSARRS